MGPTKGLVMGKSNEAFKDMTNKVISIRKKEKTIWKRERKKELYSICKLGFHSISSSWNMWIASTRIRFEHSLYKLYRKEMGDSQILSSIKILLLFTLLHSFPFQAQAAVPAGTINNRYFFSFIISSFGCSAHSLTLLSSFKSIISNQFDSFQF